MLKLIVTAQNSISQRLRRDDRGVTSVEYALLVTLIAVAIIGAVGALAVGIEAEFFQAATSV